MRVAYDAPNLYCGEKSIGDWPIDITCNNGAQTDLDQLVLSGPSVQRFTFIYFENGTWDTGVDIPCGTTQSFQATIQYVANDGLTLISKSTALTPLPATALPAPCPSRESSCPGPAGGGGPPIGSGLSVALPINVGSGDVMVRQPLFEISQTPTSMPFTLTYHSEAPIFAALVSSPVGVGWTHEYAQTLRPEDAANNRLYHITAEGFEHEYLRIAPDSFWTAVSPADLRGTVTQSGSEYLLTDLNGTVTHFDTATGRWNKTVDRWSNAIVGSYNGSGQLTTIADTEGRQITLTYTSGQVAIAVPDGSTWKLTLGTNNTLTQIFDPLHTGTTPWRSYAYATDHAGNLRLLTSIQDDAPTELEAHTYDNTPGTGTDRAFTSSQAGGTRSNVSIVYNTAGTRTVTHTIDGSTQETTTFNVVYQGGRWLATQISGACATCGGSGADLRVFTYDYANHVIDEKDGSGTETAESTFTYDANGMVLTKTEAVGKPEQRMTTYAYGYASGTPGGGLPWPSFVTSRCT